MSISRAQELRREKAALAAKFTEKGRQLAAEKRTLTAAEHEEIDRMDADIKAFDADIERFERVEAREAELAGYEAAAPGRAGAQDVRRVSAEGEGDPDAGDDPDTAVLATEKKRIKSYANAFKSYLRAGLSEMTSAQRQTLESGRFNVKLADIPPEIRAIVQAAMGTGSDVIGGFLLPPEPAKGMIEAMKAYGGMRKTRAEVISTSHGREIPWITSDDTANEGRLVGESRPATEATDLLFGQRSLNAYIYTSDYVRVPFTIAQDTEYDVEGMLNGRFAERLGRITERHYATGDGASKPEGITVGAQLGRAAPTGQTTSIKSADFTNLFHSVDPAYRQTGEFMMHDTLLLAAKLLVDTQGRPLWRSGLATREPDTIEDRPYIVNNSMPVPAASAKSMVFGDMSYYKLRDVMPPMVLRLQERFIEYGQVAYLMFSRHDGKLMHGANTANTAALCPVKYYQHSAS